MVEANPSGEVTMNLCLILDTNPASREAETVWRDACEHNGDRLEIVNTENTKYQPLVEQLHLNTFPALLQANRVLAVGIPTPESARKLLTDIATAHRH
jgi:hypothetical protein